MSERLTEIDDTGCDCPELCAMGPTCPGGMLAGIAGAGCWRTAEESDGAVVTEKAHARCPGCGHSCCPYPGLECGGDSDAVQACEGACRGCGLPRAWPLSHTGCVALPVVVPSATTAGGRDE